MTWFIFIGLLEISLVSTAQTREIDSLYGALRPLTDTVRIDCLNELSYQYTRFDKKDSAEYCVNIAYQDAKKMGYRRGLAEAIFNRANIAEHFYNNFRKEEELGRASLDLFQRTGNKMNMARLYNSLSFATFAQSKYDESLVYARKCSEWDRAVGNLMDALDAESMQAVIYLQTGDYSKAFDVNRQILAEFIRYHNQVRIRAQPIAFGEICMKIGDYLQALRYFREFYDRVTPEDLQYQSDNEFKVWSEMEFAEIYTHLGMYDSALYRYNSFDSAHANDKDLRVFLVSKGEYFLIRGNFSTALPYFLNGLKLHKLRNDRNEIMRTLLDIAYTYLGLHNDKLAFRYANDGLVIGREVKARAVLRDAYKVLYTVYDNRNQRDSAYRCYKNYIIAKDSVTADQTKGAFAAYNYEERIDLLSKEQLISGQRLNIEQQKTRNESLLRNVFLIFALAVLAVSFLVVRNVLLNKKNEKLRNQQLQDALKHRATELEMQALRAQMNPHFIFNCLNSINRFILKNESDAASNYLTQFSRLIRMVLTNSRKSSISLEEEVNMLTLYMDMEKLRFKNAFGYHLEFDPDVDCQGISVPPLLLQPFVENAIWHGLMPKKENGWVKIGFSLEYNTLVCTITDNGVGRSQNGTGKINPSGPDKSMGIQITKDRLALINGEVEAERVTFEIEDLYGDNGMAAGTKVILKMNTK